MTIAIEIPDDDVDLCEAALRDAVTALASKAELYPHEVNDFVETNTDCLILIYNSRNPQLRFDVWARREVTRLWLESTGMVKSA